MSLGVKHRRDLHRDMLDRERAQLRTQRAYDKNANEYGIYSMAETPRSLLMWAHYAEKPHRRLLGFLRLPDSVDQDTVGWHRIFIRKRLSYTKCSSN